MIDLICGLDEAGRGPLAGPVTAGCVILPEDFPVEILNDSKKLSEKKRIAAEAVIMEKACWGLGVVDHETIDQMNILRASMYAMKIAYEMMMAKLPGWLSSRNIEILENSSLESHISAITDGTCCPEISCACRCEPKADGKYPQVMAASIIAKVERDKMMLEFDKLYPQYGYAKHKGYPTAAHIAVCREIGMSPIQRKTFKF
ncbi:MAG: ribonuclease HII [Treponema sp.]|uniref:ribonuclease HII n=1 Tax=Treponema sp. TaxID=166 RepID=UPI0025D59B76|nr:ribonuclease HII [Treponema sp.]MBQ8680145.1 ribonuclease HII [Treponema sp.]